MRIYFKNLKPVSTNHAKKLTKNGRMYQTNETLAFKRAIFFKCLRLKNYRNCYSHVFKSYMFAIRL